MEKTIQRVKFKKAIARHTKIRDENSSLEYICPGEPHQRNPNAPRFEDRSQEKTEWQEGAAWKLAKNVFKLKKHERAAFFSSPENRCLPASTLRPEEREFVVDSGASMHMISKKDLSKAEMDTLTKSCSPTIVITANGEVQTHEEATVCVKEMGTFLIVKARIRQQCYRSESFAMKTDIPTKWIDGQKPTSHQRRDSDNLQHGELCSCWGSRLVKFVLWVFIIKDTNETGESFFFIFFILTFFTCTWRNFGSRKGRCT